jgi:hypothetical protein
MEDRVREQLLRSGWFPGRHIDLENEVAVLNAEGYELWDGLLVFLAEYSGLVVNADDAATPSVWIDAARAASEVYAEWSRAYSAMIRSALAPVGGQSHMTIYLSEDGEFYGGFDNQYGRLGSNFRELIDVLLNEDPPTTMLDRVLE